MTGKTSNIITQDKLFKGPGTKETSFLKLLSGFIKQQCIDWPGLKQARDQLKQGTTRKIMLKDLEVSVQHNPCRIKSSASCVDRDHIKKRPCFLCPENLYPEQLGLAYRNDWIILNNPYPIFENHLVISRQDHCPQSIREAVVAMIALVMDTDFSCDSFYNGPECGASAPDHLHFQACPQGMLPITAQIRKLLDNKSSKNPLSLIKNNQDMKIFSGHLDNRAILVCITRDPELLRQKLETIFNLLKTPDTASDEPNLNLVISGTAGSGYMGLVFPRKAHRPSCFYEKGTRQMIISPGAVDMSGLVITPRTQDHENIDRKTLLEIFSEVCCSTADLEKLLQHGL